MTYEEAGPHVAWVCTPGGLLTVAALGPNGAQLSATTANGAIGAVAMLGLAIRAAKDAPSASRVRISDGGARTVTLDAEDLRRF